MLPDWTFLTNHGHTLIFVSQNPDAKISDISAAVGITDRATQTILRDLEDAGYVTKAKVGRRNSYRVHPELSFRHPREAEHKIGDLLRIFGQE